MTKRKTLQFPELLIGKTKQMLRAALVEKQLAWEQWKRTPEGRTPPPSPEMWQVSKQSGELLAAARRTFRNARYKAAKDTTRSFPAKIRPQQMTVREYKRRREAGEVSRDGIFYAKRKRPKRYLRVSASAYE